MSFLGKQILFIVFR